MDRVIRIDALFKEMHRPRIIADAAHVDPAVPQDIDRIELIASEPGASNHLIDINDRLIDRDHIVVGKVVRAAFAACLGRFALACLTARFRGFRLRSLAAWLGGLCAWLGAALGACLRACLGARLRACLGALSLAAVRILRDDLDPRTARLGTLLDRGSSARAGRNQHGQDHQHDPDLQLFFHFRTSLP